MKGDVHFWLAPVNRYGYVGDLAGAADGPHDSEAGARKAFELYQRMRLGPSEQRYAIVRVEVLEEVVREGPEPTTAHIINELLTYPTADEDCG